MISIVLCLWNLVNLVWVTPKRLEKHLRNQGFKGNKYKLLFGDMKEFAMTFRQSKSKHINIDNEDEVLPRVVAFNHQSLQKHGRNFITWMGWKPRVTFMDPELIKEVFTKINDFQKPRSNTLARLLATGLVSHEGDKWVKHRKIINPAFNVEKLKNMVPAFHLSCIDMVGKWEKLVSSKESCELDVWPHLQALTSDVISRTAFGSSYQEGIQIFELIKEQGVYAMEALQSLHIPGYWLLATGLVSHEGDKWVKHRKIINPAFNVEKLKNMVPAFHLSCIEMVGKWEKLVSSKESCELDVWPHLQTLTSDVISRTAFGSSYQEGIQIFELIKEQSVYAMEALQSLYIPGYWLLPTKRNMKMKAMDKQIRLSIRSIIDNRLKAMKAGEGNYDDLLGIMLESNIKEVEQHQNKSHGMTINEVIGECRLFYIAGQETTSSLLVWTMILLSKHQEWQSRAREEVLNVFGDKNIDLDGLNHLKVVDMIFHEVLRLYPPAIFIARETHKDITLGRFSLPSGVQIGVPIMLIHYDEELWGSDAMKFNPDRFSEGISKATKNQTIYFPFGWGPRICIGQNFALLEVKIALAMILQRFSFELSPSYVHAPNVVLTLQPQYGAHLILHKLE
ncbi:11-oxo-beta-amyrin 30-oxidase [Artemisia annua]|uniref:11-oxo-beta-amyrin 30-oxidase n=1 Tax=Artemisia annua TaxID=35608 RepID=A0A2U1M0U0_ARTAN|nr:11-oxo-beta-amyrin 30-oxidase [Artemisia annua]